MLTLPPPFKSDLESNDTFLIPLIVVDPESESPIYISTVKGIFDANIFWQDFGLKISSIKESLNIVERKFKINNLSFDLNNQLVNGVRFSDFVADRGLLNKPVDVYYKTQSCKTLDDCMIIYKGRIRRFEHYHKKVKIQLEDLTEDKLSKKVPISKTGFGEKLYNKDHKNMPIPMVYGHVDRACTIPFINPDVDSEQSDVMIVPDDVNSDRGIAMEGFQVTESTYNQNLYPSEDINPLFIYKDDYFQVLQNYDESVLQAGIDEDSASNWQFQDEIQYELLGGYVNVKKIYSNLTSKNPPANNELQTIIKRYPNGMKILTNPFENDLESDNYLDDLAQGVNFLRPEIRSPELAYDNDMHLGEVSETTYVSNVNTNYHETFAEIPNNTLGIDESLPETFVTGFEPFRGVIHNQAEDGTHSKLQWEVFSWLARYAHVHNQNFANPNVVFIRLPSGENIKERFKEKIWDEVIARTNNEDKITLNGTEYNFSNYNAIIAEGLWDSCMETSADGENFRANVSSHICPQMANDWAEKSSIDTDTLNHVIDDIGGLDELFYETHDYNSFHSTVYDGQHWNNGLPLKPEGGEKVNYPNFWLQFELVPEIRDFLGYGYISASLKNDNHPSGDTKGAHQDGSNEYDFMYYNIFNLDDGEQFLFDANLYPQFSPIHRTGGVRSGSRSLADIEFLSIWNEVPINEEQNFDDVIGSHKKYFGGNAFNWSGATIYENHSLANTSVYSSSNQQYNSGWFIWVKNGIYDGIFDQYSPSAAGEENPDPFPYLQIPANTLIASVHYGKYSSSHNPIRRGFNYSGVVSPHIMPTDPNFITLSTQSGTSNRLGVVFTFKDQGISDEIKCDTYFEGKIINKFNEEGTTDTGFFNLGIGAIDVFEDSEQFDWNTFDSAFDDDNVTLIATTLTTAKRNEILQYNSLIEPLDEDDEDSNIHNYFNGLHLVPEFHEVNNYNAMTMMYRVIATGSAKLSTEIYSIGLIQYIVFGAALDSDMFVNIKGRTNTLDDTYISESGQEHFKYTGEAIPTDSSYESEEEYLQQTSFIEKPCDILYHFLEKEVGFDDGVVKRSSVEVARNNSMGIKCAFSLKEEIKAKDLIARVCKDTNLFAVFKGTSDFSFTALKNTYGTSDVSSTIKSEEILKYSFSRTPIENINTIINVKFKQDYANDEYVGSTGWVDGYDLLGNGDSQSRIDAGLRGYSYDYLGLGREDKVLEVEAPYIRDRGSAEALRDFLFLWNCNQHNIFKLTLPLKYLYLEVGDIVNFNTLIKGLKAYGEDYTKGSTRNGQEIYPFFIINSTNKKQKTIDIELLQLHNLSQRFVCSKGSVSRNRGKYDGVNEPIEFTLDDWAELEQFLLGARGYFTNNQKRVSDVNNDGYIDSYDLNAIGLLGNNESMIGDFNQDGHVNVVDVVQLVNHIISEEDFNEMFDINEDGMINVSDVILLAQQALGTFE